MDAYTYLCRGEVFANAETGNLVLLAIQLAQREWWGALSYLWPILAFAAGVLVTEELRHRFSPAVGRLHWRQLVILVECTALLVVSQIPRGPLDALANVLVSFVSAVQMQSFRSFEGNACATTMCTGNLRSGTEHLFRFLTLRAPQSARSARYYYVLISFFILGALLGGVACASLGGTCILLAMLPLLAVFLLMFRERLGKTGS